MPVLKSFIPPLFVINLERSRDRRESITAELRGLGVDFELFPATDGTRLSPSELAQYNEQYVVSQIARPMSASEVGCYLSHARLWRRIVDEDIPWAVILEDDVDIHGDLTGILTAIDQAPFKWDFIRLAGLTPTPSRPLCNLTDNTKLSVLLQGASGTQAFCISRAGAQKLLDYATPLIVGTIDDHVIDSCWKTGLRILAVQPYPINENRKFVSSIEIDRKRLRQESRNKPEKMTFRKWAIRRRFRLRRSIGRRMYLIIHALFWSKHKARRAFTQSRDKHCTTATAYVKKNDA